MADSKSMLTLFTGEAEGMGPWAFTPDVQVGHRLP